MSQEESIAALEARNRELLEENNFLREAISNADVAISDLTGYREARELDARRFQAVLVNNREGILLVNPEGLIIEIMHTILGHASQGLIGADVTAPMVPEAQERFRENLRLLVANPSAPLETEYEIVNARGEHRWIEVVMADLLDVPGINAIVLNYRDKTEETRAGLGLSIWTAMSESPHWAIVSQDLGGRITMLNQTAMRLLGYRDTEFIGCEIDLVLPQTLHGGRVKGKRKDGTEVMLKMSTMPLRDKRGNSSGFVQILSENEIDC